MHLNVPSKRQISSKILSHCTEAKVPEVDSKVWVDLVRFIRLPDPEKL